MASKAFIQMNTCKEKTVAFFFVLWYQNSL